MRTLIVDDHNLVRAGIRRMLEGMSPHTDVVGETGNGREALQMIGDLDVELMLTDLSMPDIDGINLIRKAIKKSPDIRCVVLSMHTAQEHVVSALRAGACGYIHKDASADELHENSVKPGDWSAKFKDKQWMIRAKVADRPVVYGN